MSEGVHPVAWTLSWVNMNFSSDHKPPELIYSQWVGVYIPRLPIAWTLSWVNMNFSSDHKPQALIYSQGGGVYIRDFRLPIAKLVHCNPVLSKHMHANFRLSAMKTYGVRYDYS